MACYYYLGYGAHAYGICSEDVEGTVFGWCFVGRTLCAIIHAVYYTRDILLLDDAVGKLDELCVVGSVHFREAWTCRYVLAAQRVFWKGVDVVGDNHKVAHVKSGVGTSSSIADEERLDAQFVHDANGERYFLHGVALIEVEAALHGQDVNAAQLAEDELAAVSFDG